MPTIQNNSNRPTKKETLMTRKKKKENKPTTTITTTESTTATKVSNCYVTAADFNLIEEELVRPWQNQNRFTNFKTPKY